MAPEGSSGKTWIIIIIIAIILAIAGFWYYSSGDKTGYEGDMIEADGTESAGDNTSTGTDVNTDGSASGDVNFNTADDLPPGSIYPDSDK